MPKTAGYIQIGDGPEANQEEIDCKVKLLMSLLKAVDGGGPNLETAVALAIAKKMAENAIGQTIDVHVQVENGESIEEVRKRIQERYERTGSVEPPITPPGPADPSVH